MTDGIETAKPFVMEGEFIRWHLPAENTEFSLRTSVMRRLAKATRPVEAGETPTERGGLLLGKSFAAGGTRVVKILEVDPCEAVDLHWTLNNLAVRLEALHSRGLIPPLSGTVLGFYRISTDVALTGRDHDLARARFGDSRRVFLLLKESPAEPSSAALYFWKQEVLAEIPLVLPTDLSEAAAPVPPAVSIPVDRVPVVAAVPTVPTIREPAIPAVLRVEQVEPSRWTFRRVITAGICVGVACLLGVGVLHIWFREPARSETTSHTEVRAPLRADAGDRAGEESRRAAPATSQPHAVPANEVLPAVVEAGAGGSAKMTPAAKPMAPILEAAASGTAALPFPLPSKTTPERRDPLEAPPRMQEAPAAVPAPPTALPTPILQPVMIAASRPPPAPEIAPRPIESPVAAVPVTQRERIGPQVIKQARPVVPSSMKALISRAILVKVTLGIDASGNVVRADAAPTGSALEASLSRIAVSTARLWKFKPAREGNENVPSELPIQFQFSPGR